MTPLKNLSFRAGHGPAPQRQINLQAPWRRAMPCEEPFQHGHSCWVFALALVLLSSCGYHVAGKADLVPKRIHTIAIPPFGNATSNAKLSERVTSAVTREFISRTRYKIVADTEQADAVLSGAVINLFSYSTVFDPATNRASAAQVIVVLQVTLTDRSNGAALFTRPNFEFRERYEISVDARTYFEESDAALERLSRDVARSVVSAVLEGF